MESFPLKSIRIENRAFTLVEMLVVLAIISILTVVLVTGQTTFNRSNLLTDTAYTVALSIRETQTLGLSSRVAFTIPNAGYGIHFGDSTAYYDQFADIYPAAPGTNTAHCPEHTSAAGLPDSRPGNCYYDSTQGEQARHYTFGQGFNISKICGSTDGGNTWLTCVVPGAGTTLDIVYERPNTQAVITMNQASVSYTAAAIDISSPQGGTRCVIATQFGEVNVSTICP